MRREYDVYSLLICVLSILGYGVFPMSFIEQHIILATCARFFFTFVGLWIVGCLVDCGLSVGV